MYSGNAAPLIIQRKNISHAVKTFRISHHLSTRHPVYLFRRPQSIPAAQIGKQPKGHIFAQKNTDSGMISQNLLFIYYKYYDT